MSRDEVTPDRALVFEVIGPVQHFVRAANAAGLEWLGEDYALEDVDPDEEDESGEDERESQEDPAETPLYVTMPTLAGLQKVLSLWRRYSAGEERPEENGTVWWTLFGYLNDVRPWSPKDRVDPRTRDYVARLLLDQPDRMIRIEVDLWYRQDPDLRADARRYVDALMASVGGRVLDFVTIEPISYQAALVELTAGQARSLASLEGPIAEADRLMRVRPQSFYAAKPREDSDTVVGLRGDRDPASTAVVQARRAAPSQPDGRLPIAAILDGYPVDRHELLSNRVAVREVEVRSADVPVERRTHGTAMASFILHGDLDGFEEPLARTLAAVPILAAPQSLSVETTPPDKLPIGMVYRAVLALVADSDGRLRNDSDIVILNHSICDREAPFARRPSNWAKLLDYLSHEYRLLFVVSAGNILDPFDLDTYNSCNAFSSAPSNERQIVLLRSVEGHKGRRVILSPAESVNALTVGAVHEDHTSGNPVGHLDPYAQIGVANLGSSVGLGINRGLKPDLVEAGGRQLVRTDTQNGVVSAWGYDHPDIGQRSAVPDRGGDTTKTGRSTGTSNAAALVTRGAIKVADALEPVFAATGESWVDAETRAVTLKALLAHGCAWGQTGTLLHTIYEGRWQRKREAIGRILGYGRPNHARVVGTDGSRITLLADDMIGADDFHEYRLPIPRSMIGNRELRRITITLAWSSPIDPLTQRYRGVLVELVDGEGKRDFWKGVRKTLQPPVYAGRRGTLQHVVLEGKNKINSAPSGDIIVGVQARADIPRFRSTKIPYALAMTLELADSVTQTLYADVQSRVRQKRIPVAQPVRTRVRTR